MVIANSLLEQFTVYNCPDWHADPLRCLEADMKPPARRFLYLLRQFENLHDLFLSSKNKKGFVAKKVHLMETFVLVAKGDMVGMACIAHNRTNREPADILSERVSMAKIDFDRSFLSK